MEDRIVRTFQLYCGTFYYRWSELSSRHLLRFDPGSTDNPHGGKI
jgi:hypothetical protein